MSLVIPKGKNTDQSKRDSLIFALQKQVEIAIFLDELKRIEDILDPEKYEQFTLSEKEKYIFDTLAHQFVLNNKNNELLKYFIDEYKISEENSIDIISSEIKKDIEPLFELRRLNKDLNLNLKINNIEKKKLKV